MLFVPGEVAELARAEPADAAGVWSSQTTSGPTMPTPIDRLLPFDHTSS